MDNNSKIAFSQVFSITPTFQSEDILKMGFTSQILNELTAAIASDKEDQRFLIEDKLKCTAVVLSVYKAIREKKIKINKPLLEELSDNLSKRGVENLFQCFVDEYNRNTKVYAPNNPEQGMI